MPSAPFPANRILALSALTLGAALTVSAVVHLVAVTGTATGEGRHLLDARHGVMLYVGVTAVALGWGHVWVGVCAWRGKPAVRPTIALAATGAMAFAAVAFTEEGGGFWIGVAWEGLVLFALVPRRARAPPVAP